MERINASHCASTLSFPSLAMPKPSIAHAHHDHSSLTEAKSPFWRSIQYPLLPPLGLANRAAHCDAPDLVVTQDDDTNAHRVVVYCHQLLWQTALACFLNGWTQNTVADWLSRI